MKKTALVLSFMMLGVFGFPGTELSSSEEKMVSKTKANYEALNVNPCYAWFCSIKEENGQIIEYDCQEIEVECDH